MKKQDIFIVLHNTLRNGKRCAEYITYNDYNTIFLKHTSTKNKNVIKQEINKRTNSCYITLILDDNKKLIDVEQSEFNKIYQEFIQFRYSYDWFNVDIDIIDRFNYFNAHYHLRVRNEWERFKSAYETKLNQITK